MTAVMYKFHYVVMKLKVGKWPASGVHGCGSLAYHITMEDSTDECCWVSGSGVQADIPRLRNVDVSIELWLLMGRNGIYAG